MEEEIKPNYKYLIMCRHGERADFANYFGDTDEKEMRDGDPQLTEVGIDQAKQTGEMLSKMLKDFNVKSVKIYASPFVRTLQTAMCIADKIGVNSVETHDGFVDYMTNIWMPIALDEVELRIKWNHSGLKCWDDSIKLDEWVTKRNKHYYKGIEHIKITEYLNIFTL